MAEHPDDQDFMEMIRVIFRSIATVFVTLILAISGCTFATREGQWRHEQAMAAAGYEEVIEEVQTASGTSVHELWKPAK